MKKEELFVASFVDFDLREDVPRNATRSSGHVVGRGAHDVGQRIRRRKLWTVMQANSEAVPLKEAAPETLDIPRVFEGFAARIMSEGVRGSEDGYKFSLDLDDEGV
ncbi:hypothetical protein AGABI2DRAFT_143366 [Agaricus bisporus var. bisporus H97]|uniref:hypothetical protein n=1 Tax=Agaricus bisporus var. bisporus (strain H97 / ATCC MYA-4626 / FGSC 10389) TaxID=936046 RepID=UPI00029F646E|nr:hypothetical protein AGABI2DRAFT_143366 [Agaricus bisporus var. bisporus H97]EKV47835.1 hypothetical protein AGABI2DRAFT_143366 [Agaricus bisporus var. bisporus H97]